MGSQIKWAQGIQVMSYHQWARSTHLTTWQIMICLLSTCGFLVFQINRNLIQYELDSTVLFTKKQCFEGITTCIDKEPGNKSWQPSDRVRIVGLSVQRVILLRSCCSRWWVSKIPGASLFGCVSFDFFQDPGSWAHQLGHLFQVPKTSWPWKLSSLVGSSHAWSPRPRELGSLVGSCLSSSKHREPSSPSRSTVTGSKASTPLVVALVDPITERGHETDCSSLPYRCYSMFPSPFFLWIHDWGLVWKGRSHSQIFYHGPPSAASNEKCIFPGHTSRLGKEGSYLWWGWWISSSQNLKSSHAEAPRGCDSKPGITGISCAAGLATG